MLTCANNASLCFLAHSNAGSRFLCFKQSSMKFNSVNGSFLPSSVLIPAS